ncbi:hypothetical protein HDZ31DRAFT_71945 [Schizophyllum fasciatum]
MSDAVPTTPTPPTTESAPYKTPKDGNIIDWYKSSPPIDKIPCARNSLLSGLASAVGFGALRGISGGPLVAANWAFGSFMTVSMGTWWMCWRKFEQEKEQFILRPIVYTRKGVDENSFQALPGCQLYADLPRIRGKAIPFDKYSTYGYDWLSVSALVFYARPTASDPSAPRHRFALKVAFNIEEGQRAAQFMENLRREALLYHVYLGELQGQAVPKHYGVWCGRTPWNTTMACVIMEWGGRPFVKELIEASPAGDEQRIQTLRTLQRVHDAGIEHNVLVALGFRHLLYDAPSSSTSRPPSGTGAAST